MKKRVLAIVLSAGMLLTTMSAMVLAADTATEQTAAAVEESADPGTSDPAKEETTSIESAEENEPSSGAEAKEAAAITKLQVYSVDEQGNYLDWIIDGKVTGNMPKGCTFNASTKTMTLNSIYKPTTELWFEYEGDTNGKNAEQITINLAGTSTLGVIYADKVLFKGSGTLNANQLNITELTIQSGTFNLDIIEEYSSAIYTRIFTQNSGTINISADTDNKGDGIYAEYNEENGKYTENSFRFLGGTVNITGNIEDAIEGGPGNIDIYNSTINIDQNCSNGFYGLDCGDYDNGHYYGGTINLKDADITIRSTGFDNEYTIMNFSRLNDISNNHVCYDGISGPQYKYQLDEAFNISFTVEDGTTVYERCLDSSLSNQKNYFRITYKDVPLIHDPAFSDVTDTAHPYYNAIYWAADNDITTGFPDGTFKPYDNCTRGQVVTFLWRLAGKPEPSSSAKARFSDMVASSHPYYKAILWAVEKGITTGFNDGTFKPFDNCSRGQIVTFIYRYAGNPSVSGKTANFKDMVSSGHPFYNPIVWASTNGITTGFSDNTFGPAQKCTRGQVVTFLYRYSK